MTHLVSKSGFVLILLASLSVVLAGCGRKPSINNLKPPSSSSEEVVVSEPENAATLDGKKDGQEPVGKAKPQRPFVLDFLL